MRPLLLSAALFLCAGMAWSADGLGRLHGFRNWVVGCDNTRRCEAQGYGSQDGDSPDSGRAALILRREAGPHQQPVLRFAYSGFEASAALPLPGQRVRVAVGKLRFDMPPVTAQQTEPEVPPQHVPALLAAVLKADTLQLSAGQKQWQVSLDGATAALLQLDDLQGRVGTPGALVRQGRQPEASVPQPLPPLVQAARLPPTTPADRQLAKAIAARLPHSENDCPDFNPGQDALQLLRLTPSTLLVLQACWRGAYQTGSRVWQVDDRPPHRAKLLSLPTPDGGTADSLVTDGLQASDTLELQEAAKSRGIGDCWVSREWTWTGERLALVYATESPCQLFEAGGLMVALWRVRGQ